MTRPSPFAEAVRFRQGRSGASRDRAIMVLRRTLQERSGSGSGSGSGSRSRSNPKLPPLKRRVTFFCLKQQKKGNQRKVLFFESRARAFDADAGIFHTRHPCPDEKRPASLRAALWVFFSRRECSAPQSNRKITRQRQRQRRRTRRTAQRVGLCIVLERWRRPPLSSSPPLPSC